LPVRRVRMSSRGSQLPDRVLVDAHAKGQFDGQNRTTFSGSTQGVADERVAALAASLQLH
jgi:hypothetical protein